MLRIARQNLSWSAVYNFGSLPLAALGLIPPWLAALGMSLSSIAVVLNAARLLPRRRASRTAPAMNILLVLVPLSLALVAFGLWAFFWAVGNGQFDDLESAGWDALLDRDE